MAELDEPETAKSPVDEKTQSETMKPRFPNKSLIEVQEGEEDGMMSSETSSLAAEDEATLASSTPDLKSKPPRKLIEDERRATGRISAEVWKTYLTVCPWPLLDLSHLLILRRSVDLSGVCIYQPEHSRGDC